MSLNKTPTYQIHNLGYWAGRVRLLDHAYAEGAEDIAMFHAPSECYADLHKGHLNAARKLVREFEQVTKLPIRVLLTEMEARTTGKWLYYESGMGEFSDVAEAHEATGLFEKLRGHYFRYTSHDPFKRHDELVRLLGRRETPDREMARLNWMVTNQEIRWN